MERVLLFEETCIKLLNSSNSNNGKIVSEIGKLRQWMQKHQNEVLPDNHKAKIITIIQYYWNYGKKCNIINNNNENIVMDAVVSLIDDCLKLPEGKLISSKSKQQLLKLLEQSSSSNNNNIYSNEKEEEEEEKWKVEDLDVEKKIITISKHDDVEEINVNDARLFDEIKNRLDNDRDDDDDDLFVLVKMNGNEISSIIKLL